MAKKETKGLFERLGKTKKETTVFDTQTKDISISEIKEETLKQAETLGARLEKLQGIQNVWDSKLYFQTVEEQMGEAIEQIKGTREEYDEVTASLTDIQKIDNMSQEDHATVVDAAKRIIACTQEREHLMGREIRISKDQYQMIEQYENELPTIIKNLKSNEEALALVKNDMRLLEGEKGRLRYEREELLKKQKSFRNAIWMVLILVASLGILFLVIYLQTGVDMRLPVMIALAAAAAAGSYVFLKSMNDRRELVLNERKMNKAISLLNTTKIRYVNYSGTIDYMMAKYNISNSIELNHLWTQYVKVKDEEERFLKNSKMLEMYQEVLTTQMRRADLREPEIWIYKTQALADEKEMVEVRHQLNERRAKLREKIEYNQGIILNFTKELSELVVKEPDYALRIQRLLKKFDLTQVL